MEIHIRMYTNTMRSQNLFPSYYWGILISTLTQKHPYPQFVTDPDIIAENDITMNESKQSQIHHLNWPITNNRKLTHYSKFDARQIKWCIDVSYSCYKRWIKMDYCYCFSSIKRIRKYSCTIRSFRSFRSFRSISLIFCSKIIPWLTLSVSWIYFYRLWFVSSHLLITTTTTTKMICFLFTNKYFE